MLERSSHDSSGVWPKSEGKVVRYRNSGWGAGGISLFGSFRGAMPGEEEQSHRGLTGWGVNAGVVAALLWKFKNDRKVKDLCVFPLVVVLKASETRRLTIRLHFYSLLLRACRHICFTGCCCVQRDGLGRNEIQPEGGERGEGG